LSSGSSSVDSNELTMERATRICEFSRLISVPRLVQEDRQTAIPPAPH
jgi:hypothetical protein